MRGYHAFLAQVPTPVPLTPTVGHRADALPTSPEREPAVVLLTRQPLVDPVGTPTDDASAPPMQPRPA